MLTKKDGSKVLQVMGAIWMSLEKIEQEGLHLVILSSAHLTFRTFQLKVRCSTGLCA